MPRWTTRPIANPGARDVPVKLRGTVLPTPSSAPLDAPRAGSTSASSIATVSSTSTSSSANCRGSRGLHGKHAKRPPGAAHRHCQQRGVRLLVGLGPIGEDGMVLRVRQVQHLAGRGDTVRQCLRRRAAGCGRQPPAADPRLPPVPECRPAAWRRPSRHRWPTQPRPA